MPRRFGGELLNAMHHREIGTEYNDAENEGEEQRQHQRKFDSRSAASTAKEPGHGTPQTRTTAPRCEALIKENYENASANQ
jgi:hypothetical protein